jgi:hypothetical protein
MSTIRFLWSLNALPIAPPISRALEWLEILSPTPISPITPAPADTLVELSAAPVT